MATITPLDAVLGAEVRGVDIGAGVGVGDSLMRTLTGALYAHRVIVIRDQRLDEDRYLRFGGNGARPSPTCSTTCACPGIPR